MGLRLVLCLLLCSLGCSKRDAPKADTFTLGFFPNLTHAQALVGHADGTFQKELGETRLNYRQFNAGPAAMEALIAGSLDASYVGSGPAITAFIRSKGGLKVIAGSAANGAVLVVKSAGSLEELKGKRVGTPQLGNTQDIALRYLLKQKGIPISEIPKPDAVAVTPMSNADILGAFQRGDLEGAWVPEPWGARLVHEAGAKILIDERTLWEGGRFPTTMIVASEKAVENKRDQLKALLRAHVALTQRAAADRELFAQQANEAFAKITGKKLDEAVLRDSLARLELTTDPMAAQLAIAAAHAHELSFAPSADVSALVDDSLIREVEAKPQ